MFTGVRVRVRAGSTGLARKAQVWMKARGVELEKKDGSTVGVDSGSTVGAGVVCGSVLTGSSKKNISG